MHLARTGLAVAVVALSLSAPVISAPTALATNVCNVPAPGLGAPVTCGATGGGSGTVSVPPGANRVVVTVIGGGGAGGAGDQTTQTPAGGDGGDGAKVTGILEIHGETSLDVVVGAPGTVAGRFLGGSGGGFSAITSGGTPLVVAGGGGGGGGSNYAFTSGAGGDGAATGGTAGSAGADFVAGAKRADGGRGGADGVGGRGGAFVDEGGIVNGSGSAGQSWSGGGAGGAGAEVTYIDTAMSAGGGGSGYGGGGGGALASHGAAGGGAGGSYASPSMRGVAFAPAESGPGVGSPGVSEVTPSSPKAQAGQVILTFSADTPALDVSVFSEDSQLLVRLQATGLLPGERVMSGRAWAPDADRECTTSRADTAYCRLKQLQNGTVYSVNAMVTTSLNRTLLAREVRLGMPLAPNTAPRVADGKLTPNGWRAVAAVNGELVEFEVSYDATTGTVSGRLDQGGSVAATTRMLLEEKGSLQAAYDTALSFFVANLDGSSWYAISLFSKKHVLGTARVGADGSGRAEFSLPKGLSQGKHTLQLNGYLADGLPVTIDIPVRVRDGSASISRAGSKGATVQVFPICRSQYSFTVQRKSGSRWIKAISAKTTGSRQSRAVKLKPGVYRAKIAKKCGNPGYTTKSVKIGK